MKGKTLVVDGTNTLYRAHFASPSPLVKDNLSLSGINIFFNILRKELRAREYRRCVVIFDNGTPTFRHKLFPKYKSGRNKVQEVVKVLHNTRRKLYNLLPEFGLCVVSKNGIEADDICATFSGPDSYILSRDKDFAQLCVNGTKVINPDKGLVTKDNCKEIYGIPAHQVIDYLMLRGDTVDAVPGVKGVGHVTAVKMLEKYERAEDTPYAEKYMEQFVLTRDLITLRPNLYSGLLDMTISSPTAKFSRMCEDIGLSRPK